MSLLDNLRNGTGKRPVAEKPRAKPRQLESSLQRQCVAWFSYQYPGLCKLLHATPNGGRRDKATAAILKAEGVQAGYPDLSLDVARNGYHGLRIEMKYGKEGVLSTEQKEMLALLREQGYRCEVVRDFDQFCHVINDYLK